MLRVVVAGITGWTGAPLARAIEGAQDLELAAGVARSAEGRPLSDVAPGAAGRIHATVAEGLGAAVPDVLVDFTSASAVRANVDAALTHGAHAVVGSSGLTDADYASLDTIARDAGLGIVAAGNFSILAATLLHAATRAAAHIDHWEVIDYASATKPDAPSGTARELAERLGEIHPPTPATHDAHVLGAPEARGANIAGTRVHSLRLPGYVVSTDAILTTPHERLVIRHEAGGTPDPYIAGTLLAIRRVPKIRGVLRGLDRLLFGA